MGAEGPFFSPDGRWVGFWQAASDTLQSGELKKVPLAGGPIVTICRTALPAGISWGPNGHIIFANHGGGGLWEVADVGGTPEALTTPDSARGELSHRLHTLRCRIRARRLRELMRRRRGDLRGDSKESAMTAGFSAGDVRSLLES